MTSAVGQLRSSSLSKNYGPTSYVMMRSQFLSYMTSDFEVVTVRQFRRNIVHGIRGVQVGKDVTRGVGSRFSVSLLAAICTILSRISATNVPQDEKATIPCCVTSKLLYHTQWYTASSVACLSTLQYMPCPIFALMGGDGTSFAESMLRSPHKLPRMVARISKWVTRR